MYPIDIHIDWWFIHIHVNGYEGFYYILAFTGAVLFFKNRFYKMNMAFYDLCMFLIFLIPGAILGAKLSHVLLWEFNEFINDPVSFINPLKGGASEIGGIILGVFAAFLFAKYRKISFLALSDAGAPAICVGLMIGRIGCFLNGDSYGYPTKLPFGVIFNERSLAFQEYGNTPLHPTQLYEVIGAFFILLIFFWLDRKKWFKYKLLFVFMIGYGVLRFFLEMIRSDHEIVFEFGPKYQFLLNNIVMEKALFLSTGQIVSLAMLLFGITGLFIVNRDRIEKKRG